MFFTSQGLLHPRLPIIGIAALLSATWGGPALAGTATLKSSGGAAWGSNNCTYGTISTDSNGNVTVTCQGGTTTTPPPTTSPPPTTTPPPTSGGDTTCPAAPGNYSVQDYPTYSNSANTIITTIGAGSGLALRFTIDKAAHPYGYKVSDQVGGTKSYVISRCPGGTDGPVDDQNGSSSVNGDSKLDSCATGGMVMHYKETSGGSASFYSSPYLPYYTSCFLPTTKAQGSATPATYYLNILNTGKSTVSIQLKNVPQP